jgi:transposase
MRGEYRRQETMFRYVAPEARAPERHPLRTIRAMVDQALTALNAEFEALYSHTGRPSILPEYLLRATLLQILYSVRSERLLVEQVDYNLLFRWFIGLSMDDPVWDHSTFTKNRDRLLEADIARRFFSEVVAQARTAKLLSDEHFSVDGTLILAWASMKRFRPKDGSGFGPGPGRNSERDFHGEKRSNDTHASETDPEAWLYRKSRGQGAQLCYQSHVLMENRNGQIVDHELTSTSGTGERVAAVEMVTRLSRNHRVTVGADRGYDSADSIDDLRCRNAMPHVAQNTTNRRSTIDGRTTRHPGYAIRQRIRKRIEETFGWGKTIGPLRQVKVRGVARVNHLCFLTYAADNRVRMRNLVGVVP